MRRLNVVTVWALALPIAPAVAGNAVSSHGGLSSARPIAVRLGIASPSKDGRYVGSRMLFLILPGREGGDITGSLRMGDRSERVTLLLAGCETVLSPP